MPKQKTKKSLVRRLKVTGTGKIMRRKPGCGHLKSRKSSKRLRDMRKERRLAPAFEKIARQLLCR